MPIDYKITTHICNVIRRSVQNDFPDLYIKFIPHKQNERSEIFPKEITKIKNNPTSTHIVKYIKNNDNYNILNKNISCFCATSRSRDKGIFSFLRKYNYFSLCFINYDHFCDEKQLKNHLLNISWHAINSYKKLKRSNTRNDKIITSYNDKNDIELYRNNLNADIFSATLQYLQGNKDSIKLLANQRITETLTPKIGAFAENFPFPICLDTLDFLFESYVDQYKNSKNHISSALKIAQEISDKIEDQSIKQWHNFAISAQEMAWADNSPETILSAAIYASENTYIQSISYMIMDKMNIKVDYINPLQDYNPFANNIENQRLHKRQCHQLIDKLIPKIKNKDDYKIFIEIAKKQNYSLINDHPIGWCASSLIYVANIISMSDINDNLITKIKVEFKNHLKLIKWENLIKFSKIKINHQRNGNISNIQDIIEMIKDDNELKYIYQALIYTKNG